MNMNTNINMNTSMNMNMDIDTNDLESDSYTSLEYTNLGKNQLFWTNQRIIPKNNTNDLNDTEGPKNWWIRRRLLDPSYGSKQSNDHEKHSNREVQCI